MSPTTQRADGPSDGGGVKLQRCQMCGRVPWPPRRRCPRCMSSRFDVFTAKVTGRIYSYTVNFRPVRVPGLDAPVVVVYVELSDGPRVLGRIAADPAQIEIGQPVEFVPRADRVPGDADDTILYFRPAIV